MDYGLEFSLVGHKSTHPISWCAQVKTLIWRQMLRMVRDPLAVKAKMIECLVIAIWYGLLYWRPNNPWTNSNYEYNWSQVIDINVR